MRQIEQIKRDSLAHEVPIIFDDTADALLSAVKKYRPARILEIGGGMGYSGRIILSAVRPQTFISIEKDRSRAEYLAEAIYPFTAIHGDAYDIMQGLKTPFDFVFLDGPKAQYGRYFDLIDKLLAPGGVIFADNMNFHGMVNGKIPTTAGARSIVNGIINFIEKLRTGGYNVETADAGDGIIIAAKKLIAADGHFYYTEFSKK
jgi:predicted O-methyltransferase YrrM